LYKNPRLKIKSSLAPFSFVFSKDVNYSLQRLVILSDNRPKRLYERRKGGAVHQDNTALQPRGFLRQEQDQVRINFTLTPIICWTSSYHPSLRADFFHIN